ncbi:hypothetical protein VTK73DRAFT_926 [Phialemonium thermophilum]|uniref:DUF8021 domain-containing protein n=1 Tax=Phialemonium thermophilum TaxID=223376 RepID=A0ABR3VU68_9PEZI
MRLSLLACLPLAATGALAADCSRELLRNLTARYVTAQSQGSLTPLSPVVARWGFNYTENQEAVDFRGASVLLRPMRLDHHRSFHDAVACRTFTELIVTDPAAPYVIGTRMAVNGTAGTIRKMESIVTKPGDWAFNATGYLYWNAREDWSPVPPEKRDTRAVLKAAGDAYFDVWTNRSTVVPLDSACGRLEGGSYTNAGNFSGETCDLGGYPYGIRVPYREYVIDEELGAVDIFDGFPGLDRGAPDYPAPDSHLFRVNQGKIRFIHTVSHCKTWNCGLNSTTFK